MLFSILIANYNNGRFFKDCYDSIVAQEYPNWECIIVDDASTDDSWQVILDLVAGDDRFKIYRNEQNSGCGFTKWRCSAIAKGELCGFVDPDDALEPTALKEMVSAHVQHPEAVLAHAVFFYCDAGLQVTRKYEAAAPVKTDERFTNLKGQVNHFAVYKNASYQKTPGIDKTLVRAVDQDLYLKLSEQGSFVFVDKALYRYRIHGTGISSGYIAQAFFWYIKVIANAEKRRGVNLENEVAEKLAAVDADMLQARLANPRYLLLKGLSAFKKAPGTFIKKLLFNR